MFTNTAASRIAQAMIDIGLFNEVRLGDGSKTPEDTDEGLNGGLVANQTISPTRAGAVVTVEMPALAVESGTVRELALFSTNGEMVDRYVIGPMTGKPNAKLKVAYVVEVVTDA